MTAISCAVASNWPFNPLDKGMTIVFDVLGEGVILGCW